MNKTWKRIVSVVFLLLLLAAAGFITWASFPLGPGTSAQAALLPDDTVTVESIQGWTVFRSRNVEAETGFIFYPGGRVDYRSYAPALKPLADHGSLVVLVPMPLSLAFFAPYKALAVQEAFPEIEHWVIGGHSLGGAMAARYCYRHPGAVQGLALWASYPASTDSLTDRTLAVLSIYGSEDGQVEKIESSRSLLPPDTVWVRVEGGNHARFGDYGPQPGDGTASISAEEQWAVVIENTFSLLERVGQ